MLVMTLRELQEKFIVETLDDCQWNLTLAAKQLGIGRATLYRWINRMAEGKKFRERAKVDA